MSEKIICIIGLGYVGLPLAVEFGKNYHTIGLDIDASRIKELNTNYDRTGEVEVEDLQAAVKLRFTHKPEDIKAAEVYIITVSTLVDSADTPDLRDLKKATETVANYLKTGDIVIYESTIFPGATEEICVPILEKISGLVYNKDFFCGYSPERINPGDKNHKVTNVPKLIAGSTPETLEEIDGLYASIIKAGTFRCASIKVAEAAKLVENAQRDINIAFVNELAKICNLIGLDTLEVLEAAGTKWNFLPFRPGLVGGHCIGVAPLYIVHKAKEAGYLPDVIMSGRKINESMGYYVANQFVKLLIQKEVTIKGAKVLVLGLTFKENCADIRNSRVVDIINELKSFGLKVSVYDPLADREQVIREYGISMEEQLPELSKFSGIVVAVGHKVFEDIPLGDVLIYDVKGIFPKDKGAKRL